MKNFSKSDLQTFYYLTVQKIMRHFQMNELYSLILFENQQVLPPEFWNLIFSCLPDRMLQNIHHLEAFPETALFLPLVF